MHTKEGETRKKGNGASPKRPYGGYALDNVPSFWDEWLQWLKRFFYI